MAKTSWFSDAELPVIDEQVEKLETFAAAMADGVIEARELERQQESLVTAMKEAEAVLDGEQHDKVTKLLVELSAYNIMRTLHELQSQRLRRAFGNASD
jgi:predicted transcriptional regulator